jgi:exonuclease SbcC
VTADESDETNSELEILKKNAVENGSAWNVEDMLSCIDKITEADRDMLERENINLKAAEQILKEQQDKAALAEMNNKLISEMESLTKEQEQATKAAEAAREQFAEAEKRQPEKENLKSKIDKINNEIPKYKERDEQSEKLKKCKDVLTKIEAENAKIKDDETALKEKIEILEKKAETLKNKPEELIHAQNFGREIARLKEKLQEILNVNYHKFESMKINLTNAQSELKSAQKKFDEASEKSRLAERGLENCRAGLLADGLVEGQPCPVCGSAHHPQLAVLPDEAVTEEELKELKEAEDKAAEKKNDSVVKAESAKTALEQYESQLKKELREALGEYEREILRGNGAPDGLQQYFSSADKEAKYANADDMKSVAESVYSELQAIETKNTDEQEALKKACGEKTDAENALEEARGNEIEKLNIRKKELEDKRTDNKTATAAAQAALEQLKDLAYSSLEEAVDECGKKQKALDELKAFIEKAVKDKEEAESRLTRISAALKTLNEAGRLDKAKEKAWVDVEQLKKLCEQQKFKVDEINKCKNTIENRIKTNKDKKDKISSQREIYEAARKEYSCCERLYNLVKGNIKGKGKITLEQYIQAAGFDSIIAAANRRLLPMSGGQFEMYRQEGSSDNRTGEFLNLEVLDNYTGHRRPVGSLSGGESFMASLALALGLSDTVSSHLGGVQMDALFVDEGFGTLDKKSIDNAMEILMRLSSTNKLVGVISHREELVESIPQQIKVTKTREGSRFCVEMGM